MRVRILLLILLLAGLPAGLHAQPQPPKDFVPVEGAPEGEQIPAMPLLGAAYGFLWVGVLGYVWMLGRRLQNVEREIGELEARKK